MSVGGGGGTLLAVDDLLLRPSVFHSPFFIFIYRLSFSRFSFFLWFFVLILCTTCSTGIRFTTKPK